MNALKHINKYFFKYKRQLIIGLIITVVARVFSLVMPVVVGNTLDVVKAKIDGEISEPTVFQHKLLVNILIIVGSTIISGLFTYWMRQNIINVSRYIEFDLKNEIFAHYEKLSLNFYKKNRTGDLMSRISEDVGQVRMYAGPAIMYSIQTAVLFLSVIPLMIYQSPKLTLYTLLPLPILSYSIYQLSKNIHQKSTIVQQFLSKISTFAQETFSGISVIKAYVLEDQTNANLVLLANESKVKNLDLAKVQALFFPLMVLLIGFSNILVIYVGGKLYISGEIASIGILAQFLIYVNMLTWPVATVGWVSSIVQRAEASQKRINEFLETQADIVNTVAETYQISGKITFKNVSFTYDDTNIQALKNLSFEIEKGKTLAILGKTGSGKSTILELIARTYDVTEGEVCVDNINVTNLNLESLRNSIGMVPQNPFLFSDSIKNNIRFGDANASYEDVVRAAKNAYIHHNIVTFKNQYDTVLGERGITLSGGQKQRVSIARAIIKKPKILLLDDCLSAVDTETEEEILGNILRLAQNITTIIVSHRVSSAKNADKIIILKDGEIFQEGTHNELIEQEGYYKELYNKQLTEKES
ncbi:MAG: ABC transporter ATP-binding protein [Flavobacteriaceae bacterium]|nr:ABC transporter ATP-binding protein [Flavobacteriaceae bacterium]MDZ4148717.1 ABC transporter ATP-binding protein [Flavobacteriaceae bacterium]